MDQILLYECMTLKPHADLLSTSRYHKHVFFPQKPYEIDFIKSFYTEYFNLIV